MTKDDIKCFENGVIVHFSSKEKTPHEKFNQLQEIKKYAADYRIKKDLDFVWYYLITEIDPDFQKELRWDDYRFLSSSTKKIYYRYFERGGLHLFVMSSPTPVAGLRLRKEGYINIDKLLNGKVKQESPIVSKVA